MDFLYYCIGVTEKVALVAQRIEQLPSKQRVGGSIPSWGAIFFVQNAVM